MTTIAYIGNFKHAHCTEVALAHGFRQNGCTVIEMQEDGATPERLFAEPNLDLVLYTRTHNVYAISGDEWTAAWRTLEAHGIQTAAFHLDRFWGLPRQRAIFDKEPMFTVGTLFTADGGNDERWQEAGVNHRWLPPAIDARYAVEGLGVRSPIRAEVLFIGTTGYHPEYPERDGLVRWLHAHYGDKFAHVGQGSRMRAIRGAGVADLIASAKVIVGDSCFANAPHGRGLDRSPDRYWSDRIPETLGRAGLLIHAEVPGLQSHFKAGDDGHLFLHEPGNWRALAEKIDYALGLSDDERRRVGLRGQAWVQQAHTYTDRAKAILETLGLRLTQPQLGAEFCPTCGNRLTTADPCGTVQA